MKCQVNNSQIISVVVLHNLCLRSRIAEGDALYNIDKIFELIRENKIQQKDFAMKIGVAPSSITEWKKGKFKPSDPVMSKIAKFFGLPIEDFYVYEDEKKRASDLGLSDEEFLLIKDVRFAFYGKTNKELTKKDAKDLILMVKTIKQLKESKKDD